MALQLLLSKKIRECPQHTNEYTRKGRNDNRTNGLLMHTLFLLHKDMFFNWKMRVFLFFHLFLILRRIFEQLLSM